MSSLDALLERMGSGAVAWKRACRVVSTSNITLSGLQTIDGVTVEAGDRVLVNGQTLQAKNGIYVAANGTWARASDFSASKYAHLGSVVPVLQGTTHGGSIWLLTTPSNTTVQLGSTALEWTKMLPIDEATSEEAGLMPAADHALLANATASASPSTLVARDSSTNSKFVGVSLANLSSPDYDTHPSGNGGLDILPGTKIAGTNCPGVVKLHGRELYTSDNKGVAVVLMAGNPETAVAEFGQLFGGGGGASDFSYWRIAWSSIGCRTQMIDGGVSKLWMVELLNGQDARFDLSGGGSGSEFQVYASGGYAIRVSGDGVVRIGVSGSSTVHEIGGSTATTVGAAGAASALPANPTGYLRVVINGTTRKIPYYAD